MKKALMILLSVFILVFVVSCGGGNPSAVAKSFMEAYINLDVDALAKVATPETVELMSGMIELAKEQQAESGEETEQLDVNTFTFTETIDGETATVAMQMPGEDGTMQDAGTIDLVNVDGKWLVSMSK
jgi:ornithine carbamoyltransferase